MKDIHVNEVKGLTIEKLQEQITEEQKEILENSKFNYGDVLKEIQVMSVIFGNRDDVVINVEGIFEDIKNTGMMSIERLFGIN